jgi:hypothetical protein
MYSDYVRSQWSGVRIPLEGREFLLLQTFQIGFGAYPISEAIGTGILSGGVSSPGREIQHCLPCTAKAKKEWSNNSNALYTFMAWREKSLTLLGNCCLRIVTHLFSWYEKYLKSAPVRVSSNIPAFYRQRQPFRCFQQRMLHVWSYMSISRQEYT